MKVKITVKSEDKETEKNYSIEQGVNRLNEFFPHKLMFEDMDGDLIPLTAQDLAWNLTQRDRAKDKDEPNTQIKILGSWLGMEILVERS